MALHGKPDDAHLIARSANEAFPPDALSEIRQERLLGADQEADFPRARSRSSLAQKVVFSSYCRLEWKLHSPSPATHHLSRTPHASDQGSGDLTNKSVAPERVGSLAASVMLQWLRDSNASLVERFRAYELFPNVDRDDNSLEGTCATKLEEAFDAAIEGQAFLLTNDGELISSGQSVVFRTPCSKSGQQNRLLLSSTMLADCAVPTSVRR